MLFHRQKTSTKVSLVQSKIIVRYIDRGHGCFTGALVNCFMIFLNKVNRIAKTVCKLFSEQQFNGLLNFLHRQKEVAVTYNSPQEEIRMIRATKVIVFILKCFTDLFAQYQAGSVVLYFNILCNKTKLSVLNGLILFIFNKQCTGADCSEPTGSKSLTENEPAPPLLPRASRSHSWEFPRQRLQVREVFGQGAFGQVVKGLAFEIAGKVGWTMVAVKKLKGLWVM